MTIKKRVKAKAKPKTSAKVKRKKSLPSKGKTEDKRTARDRSNANLKPFPPGVSGNPSGREKGSLSIMKVIREILNNEKSGAKRTKKISEVMLKAAEDGDYRFFKELLDRIDGPVKQIIATEKSPLESLSDSDLNRIIQAGERDAG